MTTNVMAPPAVTNVGSRAREIRLKIQGIPGHMGISGEAYRIAVRTRSCISGEGDGALTVPGTVQIMIMVQHP